VPRRELVDRIAAILDQERPEVVVTFGPDGITGHLDHITIGEATPRRSCGWQGTAGQACGGSSTAGSDSW
jgi:LmbE family N-acetylglucosaminyl deacetylase